MLLRCATGMLKAPVAMAAGLVFAGGIAAGLALGAGAVLVGKRLRDERQGWRGEAAPEAPAEPAANPG